MYNPVKDGAEYIEIQNIGTTSIELPGVEIGGVDFIFDDSASIIEAGEVILLTKKDPKLFRDEYTIPDEVLVYGPYLGSLDNGGERIRIKIPEQSNVEGQPILNVSVDVLEYNDKSPWPLAADGQGSSLQRKNFNNYAGDPINWIAAEPSPGVIISGEFDWRELFFSPDELDNNEISSALADADADGTVNIIEYLLGSDPRKNESGISGSFLISKRNNDSDLIELKIKRVKNPLGYDLKIEVSSDLINWVNIDDQMTVERTIDNGDGTVVLTYILEPSTTMKIYYRLRVVESN